MMGSPPPDRWYPVKVGRKRKHWWPLGYSDRVSLTRSRRHCESELDDAATCGGQWEHCHGLRLWRKVQLKIRLTFQSIQSPSGNTWVSIILSWLKVFLSRQSCLLTGSCSTLWVSWKVLTPHSVALHLHWVIWIRKSFQKLSFLLTFMKVLGSESLAWCWSRFIVSLTFACSNSSTRAFYSLHFYWGEKYC